MLPLWGFCSRPQGGLMCQTEHLGSAEPFLEGRAGAPPWPQGRVPAEITCEASRWDTSSRIFLAEGAEPSKHRLCLHWSCWCCLHCREGGERGLGDQWSCASSQGSSCSKLALSMASPELCKHPTADTCKGKIPLSSSGGTKTAKIVKADVTLLPRLCVRSVLALKSWKGKVAEVTKGSAHGSQSEAGIGNVSHHSHAH